MREQLRDFRLQPVTLFTGLLPIVGVHLCYLIAAFNGHVPWCNPYIDGCTSISATGRYPPEAFVFRATMIPAAALLIVFWPLAIRWLHALGDRARRTHTSILLLGMMAAGFLIVYATVLGEVGEAYRLQRQLGATTYFSFTFLAQLLFTNRLFALECSEPGSLSSRMRLALFLPCMVLFTVGLASVVLQLTWDSYELVEDIIEWQFALIMHLWFIVMFFAWRRTRFIAHLRTNLA